MENKPGRDVCGRFIYQKLGNDRFCVSFYSYQSKIMVIVRDHINTYEEASYMSDVLNQEARLSKYSEEGN